MAKTPVRVDYEVVQGWEQLPEGWSFTEVAGVATDSQDRVYVFNRGEHPMMVFDKEGKFLDAWGGHQFTIPHGIFIDGQDRIWTADNGDHTLRQFSADGTLLQTYGEPGKPSDTGFVEHRCGVMFGGEPFNRVCNVAVAPSGDFYVADGYGNARVHHFRADGTLVRSWGEPGNQPGQFNLPHGIALDSAGRVYVCDRENSRIQVFTPEGLFVTQWGWVNRPCDIFIDAQDQIFIAELGHFVWNKPPVHFRIMTHCPEGHEPIARVSIADPDGNIIQQIGKNQPLLPGNFVSTHGLWADSRGDLYVGEVVKTNGAQHFLAPMTPACFQKFVRRAG